MTSKPKPTRLRTLYGLVATMIVGFGSIDGMAADPDMSTCPWMVQPDEPITGLGANIATYEIFFNGSTADALFYGFTVADRELARQLTDDDRIPDLRQHGRPLEAIEQRGMTVYRLSADSILPRTIYLLAAAEVMQQPEMIDARIDPARPVAVGLRTRGASDINGPLPHRSVPGIEILASTSEKPAQDRSFEVSALGADFQLCAYQVSWN